MRAASWDGPPNPASQPCPVAPILRPIVLPVGANTSAKAFATLPPGFIPASAATANSLLARALSISGRSGFLKPFVTAEYRYN